MGGADAIVVCALVYMLCVVDAMNKRRSGASLANAPPLAGSHPALDSDQSQILEPQSDVFFCGGRGTNLEQGLG